MHIQQMTYGPKKFIGVKKVLTFDEMRDPKTYEEGYGKIMTYFSKQSIQPSGPPANIYFTWDEKAQETTMALVFPVQGVEVVQEPDLELIDIPESKAVKAVHKGDYAKLKDTHDAMERYLADNSLEFDEYAIEEYLSDPQTEPDESQWVTDVYYTIK